MYSIGQRLRHFWQQSLSLVSGDLSQPRCDDAYLADDQIRRGYTEALDSDSELVRRVSSGA